MPIRLSRRQVSRSGEDARAPDPKPQVRRSGPLRLGSYRTAILLLFLVLMTATVFAVIVNNFRLSADVALNLSGEYVEEVGEKIVSRTAAILRTAEGHLVSNAALASAADLISAQEVLYNTFWQQVAFTREIESMYVGDAAGNFVQARRTPRLATRVIDRTASPPSEKWIYRDTDYRPIAHLDRDAEYDPRERPWYQNTRPERVVQWSPVYPFKTSGKPGITATYPILDADGGIRAVLAADITLENLSDFLSRQDYSRYRHSAAVMIEGDDRVVAYPNQLHLHAGGAPEEGLMTVSEMDIPWLTDAFEQIRSGSVEAGFATSHRYYLTETDGEEYYSTIIDFGEEVGVPWRLMVTIGEEDLLTSVHRALSESVVISTIILTVALFIVYLMALQFSEPVRRLASNTQMIRDFRFDDLKQVRSGYSEIREMSDAIDCIKEAMVMLGSHFPADVARRLASTREDEDLRAKVMTLPFVSSVVHNLGLVVQSESPERVAPLLAAQLARATDIVRREKGTLDIFNGDHLSAFWGAPSPVENAAYHACRAALACSRCIDEQEGHRVCELAVRHVGVHAGEALVGDVGTGGRIRYTAVGRPVETVTLLRNLNGVYGTRVIVSAGVYEEVKEEFLCRVLDALQLADGEAGTWIYELVAERSAGVSDAELEFARACLEAFESYRERRWSEAMGRFGAALEQRPGDVAVTLLIQRCKQFKSGRGGVRRLPADWDGSVPLRDAQPAM